MISEVDSNNKGHINFEDFKKMFIKIEENIIVNSVNNDNTIKLI